MLYCVAPCCAGRACAFKSGNKLTSLMYVESKSARVTGVHTCQRQPPPPWSAAPLTGANIPLRRKQSYRYTSSARARRAVAQRGRMAHTPAGTHHTNPRARIRAEAARAPMHCCTQSATVGGEHLPLGGQQREDRRGLRRRARSDQVAELAKDVRAHLPPRTRRSASCVRSVASRRIACGACRSVASCEMDRCGVTHTQR